MLTLTDDPDPRLEDVLGDGLAEYNAEMSRRRDWRALAVTAHDPDSGALVGGLLGRTSLGLFFLDLFYLPKPLRGGGIGSQALRMAEAGGGTPRLHGSDAGDRQLPGAGILCAPRLGRIWSHRHAARRRADLHAQDPDGITEHQHAIDQCGYRDDGLAAGQPVLRPRCNLRGTGNCAAQGAERPPQRGRRHRLAGRG